MSSVLLFSCWLIIITTILPNSNCSEPHQQEPGTSRLSPICCFCSFQHFAFREQNRKAHRNGIKKPQKHKYSSTKGVRSTYQSSLITFVMYWQHVPTDGSQVCAKPGEFLPAHSMHAWPSMPDHDAVPLQRHAKKHNNKKEDNWFRGATLELHSFGAIHHVIILALQCVSRGPKWAILRWSWHRKRVEEDLVL